MGPFRTFRRPQIIWVRPFLAPPQRLFTPFSAFVVSSLLAAGLIIGVATFGGNQAASTRRKINTAEGERQRA